MELTAEQKQIITSAADSAVITAFAGTGKTSTLVALTENQPEKKFLYVAYNRAIKEESEKKFGDNTMCRTLHSLAFSAVGREYREKLGAVKVFQIADMFCPGSIGCAREILQTVRNFTHSADSEISTEHLSPHAQLRPKEQKNILHFAGVLWSRMTDKDDNECIIEHDGYLKIAQMEGHLAAAFGNSSCVLFDEAQDANPVMLTALKEAECPVVVVGDPHQSIYGFRGCVDAMAKFGGTKFSLTHSFRFGPATATLATMLLRRFKQETHTITGAGAPTEIVYDRKICLPSPHMRICRTNSGMLESAIENVLVKKNKFFFIGGINDDVFSMAQSVYGVRFNRRDLIVHPTVNYILNLGGYANSLQSYAQAAGDTEMNMAWKLCDIYGDKTYDLMCRVREENLPSAEGADTVLVTAHKSKGLEADIVILHNDFETFAPPSLDSSVQRLSAQSFNLCESHDQEVNLLYVAMTRARKMLVANSALCAWRDEEIRLQHNLSVDSTGGNSTGGIAAAAKLAAACKIAEGKLAATFLERKRAQ